MLGNISLQRYWPSHLILVLVCMMGFCIKAPAADSIPCIAYERSLYKHWIDADHDGEDTRREVLIRYNLDSTGAKHGHWFDPYTGRTFNAPESLQIDHVVALSEAHRSGAWAWDSLQRMAFANDLGKPTQLLAVYGPTNEDKGDKDPAHWLPPRTEYWKDYAKLWIGIKKRWDLSIDTKEQEALRKLLGYAADSVAWPRIEDEYRCEHKKGKHSQH